MSNCQYDYNIEMLTYSETMLFDFLLYFASCARRSQDYTSSFSCKNDFRLSGAAFQLCRYALVLQPVFCDIFILHFIKAFLNNEGFPSLLTKALGHSVPLSVCISLIGNGQVWMSFFRKSTELYVLCSS